MQESVTTFGLRLPAAIKLWISQRAHRNCRSINSEIIHVLSKTMVRDEREGGQNETS